MAEDIKPDPAADTSKPGREEEVITNSDEQKQTSNREEQITNLPVVNEEADKDDGVKKETEGERRFQEGLANNNDATTSPEK